MGEGGGKGGAGRSCMGVVGTVDAWGVGGVDGAVVLEMDEGVSGVGGGGYIQAKLQTMQLVKTAWSSLSGTTLQTTIRECAICFLSLIDGNNSL